jgi:hypothetical protein
MRMLREASLSCWCHGTCQSFDFQGIDIGGESHGGCVGGWNGGETYCRRWRWATQVCRVFGILQQRPWQEGVAALVDCICDGAPRVHSHDFQGERPESPRSALHWLYLAMALLKVLYCEVRLSLGWKCKIDFFEMGPPGLCINWCTWPFIKTLRFRVPKCYKLKDHSTWIHGSSSGTQEVEETYAFSILLVCN